MRRIVFYSWQSDLPNPTNRGLIQTALEKAVSGIAADNTVAVEPVVDRDTQGVPGSPDIASTILAKISAAEVFVADVSIVGRSEGGRPSPNPNVLIELGYAMKALGHERIVLVFNEAFGKVEELPFDLRARRALVYNMPVEASERAPERKKLESSFDGAIRAALATAPETDLSVSVASIGAIESAQPHRTLALRRDLERFLQKLDALEPRKRSAGGTAAELVEAIGKTQEVAADYSKVVEMVAVMSDLTAAIEVWRWFGKIFERYNLRENFSGSYSEADQDFFKFMGHEMFVTVVAFLLREERWEMLSRLLDEPIPMRFVPSRGSGDVEWDYASEHLSILLEESKKQGRASLHADLLCQRHTEGGGLASILPLQEFMAADFFLFLASEALPARSGAGLHYWRAWSCLYLKQAPLFIRRAERAETAQQLAKLFHLSNPERLVSFLTEHGPEIAKLFRGFFWRYPVQEAELARIGSR